MGLLTPCLGAPCPGLGLPILRRYRVSGIGSIEAGLHRAAEPGIMGVRLLLRADEVPHEVAQQLRAAAVAGLRGRRERVFQGLIDSEGQGGLA